MVDLLSRVRKEGTAQTLRVRRWCACGKRMDTGHVDRRKALDWENWFIRQHYSEADGHRSLSEQQYEEARLAAQAQTLGGELCQDQDSAPTGSQT